MLSPTTNETSALKNNFDFSLLELNEQQLVYIESGVKSTFNFSFDNDETVFLESHEGCIQVDNTTHAPAVSAESAGNGQIKASMDGGIMDVLVEVGAQVEKGDTLVILEAMKMEHNVVSPHDGLVSEVRVSIGDKVEAGELLVVVDDDSGES